MRNVAQLGKKLLNIFISEYYNSKRCLLEVLELLVNIYIWFINAVGYDGLEVQCLESITLTSIKSIKVPPLAWYLCPVLVWLHMVEEYAVAVTYAILDLN